MNRYFSELRYKEVIDVHSGFRMGYVCDAEYDDASGQITAVITPGRAKLFGLFGREDDTVMPWGSIVRVGTDIILVDKKEEFRRRKRKARFLFE
ncbi:MAG: YlmC/YmxH family sporulation protein [Eubacteriales bacterium]|nr:YlmC/YmxH family sporulation protein [Eubacteriales bacterium]